MSNRNLHILLKHSWNIYKDGSCKAKLSVFLKTSIIQIILWPLINQARGQQLKNKWEISPMLETSKMQSPCYSNCGLWTTRPQTLTMTMTLGRTYETGSYEFRNIYSIWHCCDTQAAFNFSRNSFFLFCFVFYKCQLAID